MAKSDQICQKKLGFWLSTAKCGKNDNDITVSIDHLEQKSIALGVFHISLDTDRIYGKLQKFKVIQ